MLMWALAEPHRCVLRAQRHVQLRCGISGLPRGVSEGEFLDVVICVWFFLHPL